MGLKGKLAATMQYMWFRKVINYYTKRKSTVNLGVIEWKKAFDKVNLFGVLGMLQ